MASNVGQPANKASNVITKSATIKACIKETAMSPTAPSADTERTELLGSLTTQQQQRTSARVIKKLKLEPQTVDKKGKRDGEDAPECDTPNKQTNDKDPLKFPTVKQRMPKALWSADEKSLFFEALNEYGKDFDAITSYICAKLKKKGVQDANLKTKTQVSHFYYRTWHKLSKHVHFDGNVKKVVQELYALINYGELRRKLVSVNEKTCARLGEMVLNGSIVVRARGRNLRVRTPMCRALRRLNQIAERLSLVCGRACVCLFAREAGGWARVVAAAHNPRCAVALPLRASLLQLLHALAARWRAHKIPDLPKQYYTKHESSSSETEVKFEDSKEEDCPKTFAEDVEVRKNLNEEGDRKEDNHLNMETDRVIVREQKLPQRPVLHVGPRPNAQIHLPVISPSEQLSSQKICFSSYLERMRDKASGGAKTRNSKRQRKESALDKEVDPKKFKLDETAPTQLMHIEETAIDGIELMASYKNNQDDDDKQTAAYTTEDEKDLKLEETPEDEVEKEPEREKEITEKERDSAEKDTTEKDKELSEKEKDSFSEMEDDDKYNKSDSDNESDHGKSEKADTSAKETKFKNLKVKFRIRPKKRGGSEYTLVVDKDQDDVKADEQTKMEDDSKADVDLETAIKQIRKGWSMYDAGNLTIGDLYLMFGSRSKIELDYWWALPTPPLPQKQLSNKSADKSVDKLADSEKISAITSEKREKSDKTPDKGTDSSVEEDRANDNDLLSPKNNFSQDSNDGLSSDERKNEQTSSPDHKSSSTSCNATLQLVSKLINRPIEPQKDNTGLSLLSDRLKRLLALVGNPHVTAAPNITAKCECGHICSQKKHNTVKPQGVQPFPSLPRMDDATMFRHPTPVQQHSTVENRFNLDGLPARRKRGRPRLAERRVVVQRLLPLLPKLPPPNNLIPVKLVPNAGTGPQAPKLAKILPKPPPKVMPKPPPTSTSDLSFFYVLSESNGQFYFHDGDRRIPITPLPGNSTDDAETQDEDLKEEEDEIKVIKVEICDSESAKETCTEQKPNSETQVSTPATKTSTDVSSFLPQESLSLSPSRLLHADGWLDAGHDFSLSSFLHQLDEHRQPEVDSQLRSLMAESSVDYVAKFADLAAEVTDEGGQKTEEGN